MKTKSSYIVKKLEDLEKSIDVGRGTQDLMNERLNLLRSLKEQDHIIMNDMMQKIKLRWYAKGDEKSNFYHAMLNKKIRILNI